MKRLFMVSAIVAALFLTTCTNNGISATNESLQTGSSSINAQSQIESASNPTVQSVYSQSMSNSDDGDTATAPSAPEDSIQFYDSIGDVPYGELSFDEYGRINKDGVGWLGPPTQTAFGTPFYYDKANESLYVSLYDRPDPLKTTQEEPVDYSKGVYTMWRIDLNDLSSLSSEDIIPECQGKKFIASSGNVLVCDDGTGFDTVSWQWINMEP